MRATARDVPGAGAVTVSLGYGPDGKRIRRKVGGRTKQEVKDRLEALHADLAAGIAAPDGDRARDPARRSQRLRPP